MANSFFSSVFLVLLFFAIPLHLISIIFRVLRRTRLSVLGAVHSVAFILFTSILLSAIFFLTETSSLPPEEGSASELLELKLKMSQLESIFEKKTKDLNSKILLLQEKERVIEEMSLKIQHLQNSLRNMKKSRGGSAYSEERANSLEEEVRNLWSEARKNNFDLHALQSKAYDAEQKLESTSFQVHKMEDVITEQWIQIRQLDQALQITKVRASRTYLKMDTTKCKFLKFIDKLRQHHLPESIFKKHPVLSSHVSHIFILLGRTSSGVKSYHHKLQGYVRQMMVNNALSEPFANQEIIFFLASAIMIFPFMAAWWLYSSGSPEED